MHMKWVHSIGSKISQTFSSKFKPMSTMSTSEVLFQTVNKAGLITLNRPKHLNALNSNMTHKILPKLRQWETEKSLVVIKGIGERAFCAGGDIVEVSQVRLKALDFVGPEFIMNGLIGRYKIPYVALIDGVTMGSGAGLSVHGAYRIATERTVFAMPEVRIGYFPDCGSSYFLSRLRGNLGVYLGLTGRTLKGTDVVHAGLATHFVRSSKLDELEGQLLRCKSKNDVEDVLNGAESLHLSNFSLKPVLDQIDYCFGGKTVEEIINNLKTDDSTWAQDTLNILTRVCPTSLKVTLKELDTAKNINLEECLKMEYRLVKRLLEREDFYEGVRALLIDKDQKPKWKPSTLAEVSDEIVDSFFTKLPITEELNHKL